MPGNVKEMTSEAAKSFLDSNPVDGYNLLDVRQDWEYEEFHLPGARLIPLPELAGRLEEIPRNRPTIVYCASGGRSAAGARLMQGQGFQDLYNLIGGIMSWKDEYALGPKDLGMAYFSGDETPLDILTLAYAMETNLGAFFIKTAAFTKPEISDAFKRLSKFENGHKAKVFNMAREVDPSLKTQADLEKRISVSVIEGGMSADEFIENNGEYLKSPRGAVEAAMMLETQALDLYMRYAVKAERGDSVGLLHVLAQEEKNHLAILGRLMTKDIIKESS